MRWSRPAITTTALILALAACSSDGGSTTEASLLEGGTGVEQSTEVSTAAAAAGGGTTTTAATGTAGSVDTTATTVADGSTTLAPGDTTAATPDPVGTPTAVDSGAVPTTVIVTPAGQQTGSTTTVIGGAAEAVYCAALVEFLDANQAIDDALDDEASVAQLTVVFATMDVKMAAAELVAPPAISADVRMIAAQRRQMAQFLAGYNYDFDAAEADPAVEPLFAAAETDEMLDAYDRVQIYNDDVCGLDEEF
jgi:hypothetical protein